MSTEAKLLVELFTEELPPKALKRLGEAFATGIAEGLRANGYLTAESAIVPYATPRRLAVTVAKVRPVAPDSEIVDKLMPVKVARDASGQPSEALRRKLAGLGRPSLATATLDAHDGADRVYVASDGKADYVYLRSLSKGQPLARGLQEALDETIDGLPIPRMMNYSSRGGDNDAKFVRPAHLLVALHGTDELDVNVLGLRAGRVTGGHRALSRADVRIATAEAYEETLRAEGRIIASFAERRSVIVDALAKAAAGATIIMPDALLDEVTGMVEWPVVLEGGFDAAFLTVPQECLILTMQQNQKYFALADPDGKLVPRFLVVANIELREPAGVVEGNERVLRARLADARFFYDQDKTRTLESRIPGLASVRYHERLGTQFERVARIGGIAVEFANKLRNHTAEVEQAAP